MTADSLTLTAVAESVPKARRFVRQCILDLGADGASDDAETLVSELATNAVLHARTDYTISVSRSDATVRVRVFDMSSVLPRERHYGPDSTTGRGIRLIASIALHWGVEPEADGKAVWFELGIDGARSDAQDWDEAEIDVDQLLAGYDDDVAGAGAAPAALAMAA